MLVLLTAATSAAERPDLANASRTHSPIRGQLRAVSNTWEPGTPGSPGWVHSRWPVPSWAPSSSNRMARQLPVPRSIAMVHRASATGGHPGAGQDGRVGQVPERLAVDQA